jgi:hypothetical protein
MTRDRKLPEIHKVRHETDLCTFPNIELSAMKRCPAKGNVLHRKYNQTIAMTIQKDWQKSENGLRENISLDGHQEFWLQS